MEWIHRQPGTAQLLPHPIGSRIGGPLLLTDREAPGGRPSCSAAVRHVSAVHPALRLADRPAGDHTWPGESPAEPPAGAGSHPRPSWIRQVAQSGSTCAGVCSHCSTAGRTDSGPGSSPAPNRPQWSAASVRTVRRPDCCPSEIDGHGEQLLSQHAGTRVRRVQKSEL